MAMKIELDIPAYPRATWNDGSVVTTKAQGAKEIAIAANREGLVSLARHLLTLTQPWSLAVQAAFTGHALQTAASAR
jgi:hypothetical protein